jgi:hypothetical protein
MPRLEEIVSTDRLQRAADGVVPFEPNELMERFIVMRETRPKSFAILAPSQKLALAWYEAAKRRAEMLKD